MLEAREMKEMVCGRRERAPSFFGGKARSLFKPWPRRADVTAAQIWKSLHIVAAPAVAVLTQGREVSTARRRIPATALSADVCRPRSWIWPVPRRSALTVSETGNRRASTPPRPSVRQREAFLEFKTSLPNYLARALQKVTHRNEIEGRGGRAGPVAGTGASSRQTQFGFASLPLDSATCT